jgi:hypothetical protein
MALTCHNLKITNEDYLNPQEAEIFRRIDRCHVSAQTKMEAAGETSVADYRKHLDAEMLIHLPTKALTFVPEDRKLPSYSDMLGAKRDKNL